MKKILILLILFISINYASNSIAIVKSTVGKVEIKRQNRIIPIKIGAFLEKGDIIMTKSQSSIGITFNDGSRLSLGENSVFNINRFTFKPTQNIYDIDLKLLKGKALFNSGKIGKLAPKAVKFRIPEGVIGIRGTEFLVEVK